MEQTPTGFDGLFIIKEEWMGEWETCTPSHAASCMNDDYAKRAARPETTHAFNGCRNFNST
jgi:hypothetical protein